MNPIIDRTLIKEYSKLIERTLPVESRDAVIAIVDIKQRW